MKLLLQSRLHNIKNASNETPECPLPEGDIYIYQDKRGPIPYNWQSADFIKVAIFSYYSQIITQPIGGYMSDRYGGKHIVTCSIIVCSLVTLMQPALVFATNGNLWVIGIVKGIVAFVEGLDIPACISISSHWAPLGERARLVTIATLGHTIGSTVHNFVTTVLIVRTNDWTVPFYVYGSLGLVLGVLWLLVAASTPDHSRLITFKEKFYLARQMRHLVHHDKKTVPVMRILKTLDVWIFIIGMIGHILILKISLTEVKQYRQNIFHDQLGRDDILAALPSIGMTISAVICACFSDWAFNKELINIMTLRKTFTNIGVLGCPIYFLAAGFARCDRVVAEILLVLALALEGCAMSGIRLVPLDLSPNYAGFITGISTFIGNLTSMILEIFVTGQTKKRSRAEYKILFYEMLLGGFVTTLIFAIFGKTYLKSWNVPPEKKRRREMSTISRGSFVNEEIR